MATICVNNQCETEEIKKKLYERDYYSYNKQTKSLSITEKKGMTFLAMVIHAKG